MTTTIVPCRRDPEMWFGSNHQHARERAKRLCLTECPLSEFRRCARTALKTGVKDGVWAGVELPHDPDKAKLAAARQQLQAIAQGAA